MTQSVDIHALAGAYALDALDDLERAAFGRHLAQCGSCAMEVAELGETTARLADANAEEPPPRLRANVLAAIGRTRQAGPSTMDYRKEPGAVTRWRRWTAGAVAAGVMAVGAGTAVYFVQDQRIREAQQTQQVLAAPDAVVRHVQVKGGGELSIVASQSKNAAVVVLDGLSTPDSAHAYQLWRLKGLSATDAGLLEPGRNGGGRLVIGLSGVDAIAVTLEPAAGSTAPTTTPLANLPLS